MSIVLLWGTQRERILQRELEEREGTLPFYVAGAGKVHFVVRDECVFCYTREDYKRIAFEPAHVCVPATSPLRARCALIKAFLHELAVCTRVHSVQHTLFDLNYASQQVHNAARAVRVPLQCVRAAPHAAVVLQHAALTWHECEEK